MTESTAPRRLRTEVIAGAASPASDQSASAEAESVDKVLSAAAEVVAKLPSSGGGVTVD